MKNLSKIFIATSLVVLAGCDPEFDEPIEDIVVTSGDADFSKYVALGNSLTSGFTDNALFISGQENSYPNILAMQMMAAGGGAFTQPLMPDDIGGFNGPSPLYVDGRLKLVINPETGALGPLATPAQSPLTPANGGPFGNMGVPGAKSYHLIAPNYGNPAGIGSYANPYFVRFASSPSTTVLADAATQQPTFISLWIGNNDVLSYASGGGVGVDQYSANNTDPTTYSGSDISHPGVVAGSIQAVLETLVNQGGARGVIANIPSITDIPFFTTVPYAPLTPEALGTETITTLNQTFAALNQVYDALETPERKIVFNPDGASPVVIEDETLSDMSQQIIQAMMAGGADQTTAYFFGMAFGKARQATQNDLLLFTSQTVIGQINAERYQMLLGYGLPQAMAAQLSVNGVTCALSDQWVLIPSEKQAVLNATAAYNAAIEQLANAYDLAFVDAHAAMQQLSSQSGISYYGNNYNTTYVSGGAFSLDAVHLTGKGYAIVANLFIDAINLKYGSTLTHVNPNNYPGITIP